MKICKQCGDVITKKGRYRYCSNECLVKFNKENKLKNKLYYIKNRERILEYEKKYQEKHRKQKIPEIIICNVCGKSFNKITSNKIYCSIECQKTAYKGYQNNYLKNNPEKKKKYLADAKKKRQLISDKMKKDRYEKQIEKTKTTICKNCGKEIINNYNYRNGNFMLKHYCNGYCSEKYNEKMAYENNDTEKLIKIRTRLGKNAEHYSLYRKTGESAGKIPLEIKINMALVHLGDRLKYPKRSKTVKLSNVKQIIERVQNGETFAAYE